MPAPRLPTRHFGIPKPALLLLIFSPTAVAQAITDRNIKSAVGAWITSPTSATTTYGNIGDWNVATVTDMNGLFMSKPTFNADTGRWNLASVTNMGLMFFKAVTFNQNLAGWNIFKVTDMDYTFELATKFNQNLAAWNVARVVVMDGMFQNTIQFNQNLAAWNVASVASMASMFTSLQSFNQNLAGWNVRSVKSMGGASPPTMPVRCSCARMGRYAVQRVAAAARLSASSAAPPTVAQQPKRHPAVVPATCHPRSWSDRVRRHVRRNRPERVLQAGPLQIVGHHPAQDIR
jgi:hypothetical protein